MKFSEDIINLFNDLDKQVSENMKENSMLGFDRIVFISLNIINNLSNQNNIVLRAALDLGFIINKIEEENISLELKQNIKKIESKMDNNLRGFSRLLDAVLEDYELKQNIHRTFLDPQKNHANNHGVFVEIVESVDVYHSLKNLVNMGHSYIPPVIFLYKLANHFDKNMINKWLKWRLVKKSIVEPFKLLANITDIFSLNELYKDNNLYARELFFSYICLMPNEGEVLSLEEIDILNNICKSLHLPLVNELSSLGILKNKDSINNVLRL